VRDNATLNINVYNNNNYNNNLCQVEVKVITQVALDGVEVSIVDREHSSAQKSTKSVPAFDFYTHSAADFNRW